MVAIALQVKHHAVCFVSKRRQEMTVEGSHRSRPSQASHSSGCHPPRKRQHPRSMFIVAEPVQLTATITFGVPVIKPHTGSYCEHECKVHKAGLERLPPRKLGLKGRAGHRLSFSTVNSKVIIPGDTQAKFLSFPGWRRDLYRTWPNDPGEASTYSPRQIRLVR